MNQNSVPSGYPGAYRSTGERAPRQKTGKHRSPQHAVLPTGTQHRKGSTSSREALPGRNASRAEAAPQPHGTALHPPFPRQTRPTLPRRGMRCRAEAEQHPSVPLGSATPVTWHRYHISVTFSNVTGCRAPD